MALSANQLAVTKLYLALLNRVPDLAGIRFWTNQLDAGMPLATMANIIAGSGEAKTVYPDAMPADNFVTASYITILNRLPDAAGLAFWSNLVANGFPRNTLQLSLLDAGLSGSDGPASFAYNSHRFAVAQYAIEHMLAQNSEFDSAELKLLLASVTTDPSTVIAASAAIDSHNIGNLRAPSIPVVVAAATNGISAAEKNAGVAAVVDLTGTNAITGDIVKLLINGADFNNTVTRVLTDADIVSHSATLTVAENAGWGADGNKTISAQIIDKAGHVGLQGGSTGVTLDTTAPNSPVRSVAVLSSTINKISPSEKAAGVSMVVDLTGTNAVVGDTVEVLIGGVPFASPVTRVLTASDVIAQRASLNVAAGDTGWGIDGSKILTARVTDIAGNVGAGGGSLLVSAGKESTLTTTQSEVTKTYLALLNRVPDLAGLKFWASQLDAGMPVDRFIRTIAESAEAKTVYPDILPTDAFVSAAFINLLNRIPDDAGLAFLVDSIDHGLPRSTLLLSLLNAGLTGADGVASLAFESNRLAVAQRAAEHMLAQGIDMNGGKLAQILSTVTPDPASVMDAFTAIETDNSGGYNGPGSPITIAAAANGISAAEKTAGVTAEIDLTGTNAKAGDTVQLLIDGAPFGTPVSKVLTATDITARKVSVTISGTAGWGADGSKTLSARITDTAGHIGLSGGALSINLDTTAPGVPTNSLALADSATSINLALKAAGVNVILDLNGTNAKVGDTATLLIGGKAFGTPVSKVLTAADITAQKATLSIAANDAGWGADGSKTLTAKLTDVAGNAGNAGGTLNVALDTAAPNAPTIAVAAATGGITTSEKAAGVAAVITLPTGAAAGDKITLFIDGANFATPVTKVLTGTDITARTVTLTIAPNDTAWGADGTKSLTAKMTDSAGNTGTSGPGLSVTVDTTAPGAPTNPVTIAAAAGGGINATEKTAGVAVVVDLTGTNAVAGDKFELLLDGAPFATPITHVITAGEVTSKSATVTVAGTTNWGTDGDKVVSVRFSDAAGNAGASGGALTVNVDTTAPGAPTNSLALAGGITTISLEQKAAGVAVTLDLAGTNAKAGDTATLLIGGKAFGTPVSAVLTAADISAKKATLSIAANDSGWGADGSKTLTAKLTDVAGNAGGTLNVALDTAAPTAPTLAVAVATNGINAAEKAAGVAVVATLPTGAVAGDKLSLFINGANFTTPISKVLTSADITARTVTLTIPGTDTAWGTDGNKVLTARITDAVGNTGPTGTGLTIVLDTLAPDAPANPITVAAAINSGISGAEKTAGVSVTVSLVGTNAVAGNKFEVLLDGVPFTAPVSRVLTSAEVTAQSVAITIPNTAGWGADGSKTLTARVSDTAGNLGAAGGSIVLNLDTVAPTAPANPISIAVASNGISGAEKAAGVDVLVDLTGTNAGVGDSVSILIGGVAFANAVTAVLTSSDVAAQNVLLTIPGTAGWGVDGSKNLSARVTDAAGNVGAAGGNLTVTLDGTGPGTPSTQLSIAAAAGGINAAEETAGVAVVISLSGTNATAGNTVELLLGGSPFATPMTKVLTGADITAGNTTITIPNTAGWGADGSKTISARVTDGAGNVGAAGGSVTFILDTVAPGAVTNPIAVAAASSGGINNAEKTAGVAVAVDLTGSNAIVGDRLELLINGAGFSTPVIRTLTSGDISGNTATLTIGSTAGWGVDGNKTLAVRLLDAAGNTGATAGSLSVTLDSTAPTAPTGVGITPVGGSTVVNSLNTTNTHLTAQATIVAGQATGGTAELKIGGLTIATDTSILAGDTTVTFTTSDGSPIPAELQAMITAGGVVSVNLIDAAGNSTASTVGNPTLVVDYTPPTAPTAVTLTPVGGTVIANTLNATTTHLTGQATITAGQATGGSATLRIAGVVVASDSSILAGDTTVTFTTSDGTPTPAELQALIAAGGVATVILLDAAGNPVTSAVSNPTLLVDYAAPTVAAGTPLTFVDNAGPGTYDTTDVIKLFFNEAVAVGSIGTPVIGGAGGSLDNSVIAAVGAVGGYATEFDITLANGTAALSLATGTTISLVGVDAAGNSANVLWTLP